MKSFSDDPDMIWFAKHLCSDSSNNSSFCISILYECLTREKPEMIRTCMELHRFIDKLPDITDREPISNLMLIRSYYDSKFSRRLGAKWIREPLLQSKFLNRICRRLGYMFQHIITPDLTRAYIVGGIRAVAKQLSSSFQKPTLSNSQVIGVFGAFVHYKALPPSEILRDTLSKVAAASSEIATLQLLVHNIRCLLNREWDNLTKPSDPSYARQSIPLFRMVNSSVELSIPAIQVVLSAIFE